MRTVFAFLVLIVVGAAPPHASTPRVDAAVLPDSALARQLFARLEGRWACAGGFANGRPLAADLAFAPAFDGQTLRYEHRDRPPTQYVQEATWGYDPASHTVQSLAFGGMAGASPSPLRYTAHDWTANEITLYADTLTTPPFAPNRFEYAIDSGRALSFRWERERDGRWVLGDSLRCRPAVGAGP